MKITLRELKENLKELKWEIKYYEQELKESLTDRQRWIANKNLDELYAQRNSVQRMIDVEEVEIMEQRRK